MAIKKTAKKAPTKSYRSTGGGRDEGRGERQDTRDTRDDRGGGRDRGGRGNYGRGGGGGGRRGGGDTEFIRVTGLFESKKGGSFSAFLNRDALDALAEAREDDVIGVSGLDDRPYLWVGKKK